MGDARAAETELGEGRLELGGFGSEGGDGDDDDDGLFQAFGRHRHPWGEGTSSSPGCLWASVTPAWG